MITSNFAGFFPFQPLAPEQEIPQGNEAQTEAASQPDDAAFLIYLPLILNRSAGGTLPPPDPADEEVFIIPADGGELTALDGALHVTFPDEALQEAIRVRVRSAENIQARPPYLLNGWGFEIVAESVATGQAVRQFDAAISLNVAYETQTWAEKDAGLTLFYFDQGLRDWRPLSGYVDRALHQIHAASDHLTVFSAGAQSWEASRLPSLQGFQVSSFTGASSYAFPIQVPPGPGGLQPGISLNYNSQVADSASAQTQGSWTGLGWSLELGSIQRNMNGTDDYLGDDTFSLNVAGVGSMLLPVADPLAQAAGAEAYRLANESFWRIWHYPSTGKSDDSGDAGYLIDTSYWLVWDKTGTQYRFDPGPYYPQYHTPLNSCNIEQLQRWQWPLTKITDKFGNTLDYSYKYEYKTTRKCDPGQDPNGDQSYHAVAIYPDRVTYGNQRYHIEFITDTLRTDYKASWLDLSAARLFERSRLKAINIWHDPDGNWNTPNELIRKYELTYAQGSLLPNIGWRYQQGQPDGKMHSLAAITEYGSDAGGSIATATNLPPTLFTYTDGMHLTYVDNGYGGSREMSYQPWHADYDVTEYQKNTTRCDPPTWMAAQSGDIRVFASIPGGYCANMSGLTESFQPGTSYEFKTRVDYLAGEADRFQVGVDGGVAGIVWGPVTAIGYNQSNEFFLALPAGASQFAPVYRCWKDSDPNNPHACRLSELHVTPMLTRYRVTEQTSHASLTGQRSTVRYEYGPAAVNDAAHSWAVAATAHDAYRFADAYSEFRGHLVVTMTAPSGETTITWFGQDDDLAGMTLRSQSHSSDGRLIGESISEYVTSSLTETLQLDRFPREEEKPNQPYDELHISWTRLVAETTRSYQGYAPLFQGTQTRYEYDNPTTGYGDLLATTTYEWRDAAWVAHLRSQTSYVSRVDGSHYLAGLPVLTQQFACSNGACAELLGETRLFYDSYPAAPASMGELTRGALVGQRVLLDNKLDRYADTQYAYDAWGNPTQVTTYTGYGSSKAFASSGKRETRTLFDPTYHTYALSITTGGDGDGGWKQLTTQTAYDYRLSVPLNETDPNGQVTRAEYDVLGRLTAIRRPGDESGLPSLALSYHEALTYFWTEARQNLDDVNQLTVRKIYTGLGQLVQAQQANVQLPEGARDLVSDTFYDASGRVVRQSVPYAQPLLEGYHQPDISQLATQTEYDTFGRPWKVTQPDGSAVTTTIALAAEGGRVYQQVTVADAAGIPTTQWADTFGRTTRVVPQIGPHLEYLYDPAGRLKQVNNIAADSEVFSTTLTYDLAGRKLAMDDPDMGIWQYEYDALGNLLRQKDALGTQIAFTYDGLNRITLKAVTPGSSVISSGNVAYLYDQGPNALGQRTGMIDAAGTVAWAYNRNGQVISQTRTITAVNRSYTIRSAYNDAGQLTAITYPDGEVVTNSYNRNGQPLGLQSSYGEALVRGAEYDTFARLIKMTFGNELTTHYDYYDPDEQGGRLRSLRVGDLPNPLLMMEYNYDRVGNIMQIVDRSVNVGVQALSFTYDDLHRLKTADASGGQILPYHQTFNYDAAGRLQDRTTYTTTLANATKLIYSYAESIPHAAIALGGDTYAYDANGNMTKRIEDGIAYIQTWNSDNKLARVTWVENGQPYTTTFVYDGDGNRLLKIETLPRVNGSSEVTTIYIGGIYEEKVDTTAQRLSGKITSWQDGGGKVAGLKVASWQVEGWKVAGSLIGMVFEWLADGAAKWLAEGAKEVWAWFERIFARPQAATFQVSNGPQTIGAPYGVAGYIHIWCQMDADAARSQPDQHLRIVVTVGDVSQTCEAGRLNNDYGGIPHGENDKTIYLPAGSIATVTYQYRETGWGTWQTRAPEYFALTVNEGNSVSTSADAVMYSVSGSESASYAFYNAQPSGLTKDRRWFVQRVRTDAATGSGVSRGSNNGFTFFNVVFVQNDTILPTTSASSSCTNPGNTPWCKSNVSVTLAASDQMPGSGVASSEYRLNWGGWQPYTGAISVGAGTTTLGYRSRDRSGNVEGEKTLTVYVDTADPSISHSLSGTAGSNGWYRSNVVVTLAASDPTPGSGLASHQYQLNGGAWTNYTAPLTLYHGRNELYYRAADNSGRIVTAGPVYINIDTSAPTCNFTISPAAQPNGWRLQQTTVTFSSSEIGSGISAVAYCISSVCRADTGPFTLSDGSHTIGCSVNDFAGNGNGLDLLTPIKIDTQPPSITISPDRAPNSSGWYTSTVTVALSAADNYSGVSSLVYKLDNSDPTNASAYYQPISIPDGNHTLYVWATDSAGHTQEVNRAFSVDTQPPVAPTSISPGCEAESGQWQRICSDPSFTWYGASDNNLAGYDYSLDWGTTTSGSTANATLDAPPLPTSGSYSFRVRARDAAGNRSAWREFILRYDGIAPTITNPQPSGYIRTTQPAISASVADGHSGLDRAAIVIGGQNIPLIPSNNLIQYTPAALIPGMYAYTLIVTDTAGNSIKSLPTTFTVDPSTSIEILSPPDGATLNQTSTRLALSLETQLGLNASVTIGAKTYTATINDGRWVIEALPLQPGANTITARVTDPAGNVAVDTHTVTYNPAADVALAYAEKPVANPRQAPLLFRVTARPGQGRTLSGWQLTITNANAQSVGVIAGTQPVSDTVVAWDARTLNLPDGDYTYRLTMTVGSQTIASTPGTLRLKTSLAGTPLLNCPQNPLWFSVAPAAASGTAPADAAHVVIYLNGVASIVTRVYGGRWQSLIPLTVGAPNYVNVTVAALDAAGNQSAISQACGFGWEVRDPFIEPHGSLSQNVIGLDDTVNIRAYVRDNGAAVNAWVRLPQTTTDLPMSGASSERTYTWRTPTSGSFEGIAIVRLFASDAALPPNSAYEYLQPYYDLVPPSIAITWPPNGHAQNVSTLNLQGASEPLGQVAVQPGSVTPGKVNPLGVWNIPLTLADGRHTLTVQATDRAGNLGATASVNVLIDTTPPNVTITVPKRYFPSRALPISWSGTDPSTSSGQGSGVASYDVQYRLNDGSWADWLVRTTLTQATFSASSDGTYTFRLRARDGLGNTSAWRESTLVTVDTLPPVVTLSLERQNSTTYLVSWVGSDANGIARYTLDYRKQGSTTWTNVVNNPNTTSWTLLATFGSTYELRLSATDVAGNTSAWQTKTVSIASVTKYYHFAGQKVAMRQCVAFRGCDAPMYLHGDHLGSVSLTTNSGGTVAAESRYLPFGEQRWASGLSETDFSFTGQREERGFGLADYNARFYSGRLGRFVTPDTLVPEKIQGVQAWDRFSYTNNNPLRYTDTTGHFIDPLSLMVYAMIGGAVIGGAINAYQQYQETGTIDAGQVAYSALGGAVIAGGVVIAGVAAVTVAGGVAAAVTGSGAVATAACADGDCTNEAGTLAIMGPSSDKLIQSAERSVANGVNPAPGYYDVITHGNEISVKGPKGQDWGAVQVAEWIQSQSDYVSGTPVRLLACSTGGSENGIAQQLSNTLNVKVLAPTTDLWTHTLMPDGNGVWKLFEPKLFSPEFWEAAGY
jgi:RHS repeat-associated protein